MAWIPLRLSNYQQVAPLVRTGGSRHTGLAAPPHRNIHLLAAIAFRPIPALRSSSISFTLIFLAMFSASFHRIGDYFSNKDSTKE